VPRTELQSPVEFLDRDLRDGPDKKGIALCLSGGGYRAMLFHLGSLWRLNELGYLKKLARISSVSGGSITAGMLGLTWNRLAFDQGGVATAFRREVVEPIRRFAGITIDRGSILTSALPGVSVGDQVAAAYRKHLFGAATLRDLPADDVGPRFVINATNVQSAALMRFSRPYVADWRVGRIPNPSIDLAVAVAASSAFPPFLSPVTLDLDEDVWLRDEGNDLHRPPFTTDVVLTDGGVYDNLGLETAWKRYETVLVSDGGGKMAPDPEPPGDWARHTKRVLDLIDNQVRSLRKRQLIESYKLPEGQAFHRKGAYWGIRSNVADYALPALAGYPFTPDRLPHGATLKLADTPTRLKALDEKHQERLINWGYAVCDVALRRHVDGSLPLPSALPYATSGVS